MIETWRRIGEHLTRIRLANAETERFLIMTIGERSLPAHDALIPDSVLEIRNGYGSAYSGAESVRTVLDGQALAFIRSDYRLSISADYREAKIEFHDYFGLRTALLNWYTTLMTHDNWGVVIHSSCIISDGQAHLFAGLSGAGKSTVASLSRPRTLLADETSLVNIAADGRIVVHDSPFRNDFKEPAEEVAVPLRAIYLLKQSPFIRKRLLGRSEALLTLFNKIVHWQYDVRESTRLVRMCKQLVDEVPVYELEFQKNDLFWEAIS